MTKVIRTCLKLIICGPTWLEAPSPAVLQPSNQPGLSLPQADPLSTPLWHRRSGLMCLVLYERGSSSLSDVTSPMASDWRSAYQASMWRQTHINALFDFLPSDGAHKQTRVTTPHTLQSTHQRWRCQLSGTDALLIHGVWFDFSFYLFFIIFFLRYRKSKKKISQLFFKCFSDAFLVATRAFWDLLLLVNSTPRVFSGWEGDTSRKVLTTCKDGTATANQ